MSRMSDNNLNILFDSLKDSPFETIVFTYEGSGDSGAFDDPKATLEGSDEEVFLTKENLSAAHRAAFTLGTGLGVLLMPASGATQHRWSHELRCYVDEVVEGMTLLELMTEMAHYAPPGGWENNEGGHGTVTFFPKERRVELEHGENVMTTNWSSSSWVASLANKEDDRASG